MLHKAFQIEIFNELVLTLLERFSKTATQVIFYSQLVVFNIHISKWLEIVELQSNNCNVVVSSLFYLRLAHWQESVGLATIVIFIANVC